MTLVQEAPNSSSTEPAPRGLAPTPPDSAPSRLARRAFRALNRFFMVPALKAGLGPWIGTPVGGWVLLLRVRGRKSGIVRDNPLSYLVADGAVWVMAGFGSRTDWYRNLLADPEVELLLPSRAIACRAQVVDSPYIRARIIPRLMRATGAPGFLSGVNPYRSTDEQLMAATAWVPLIRLAPEDELLVAGPDDPGGLGWLWRQPLLLVAGLLLGRRLRALVRR
jgi:deazaflavin-dependent oxidoreductase (nitroreductase family)